MLGTVCALARGTGAQRRRRAGIRDRRPRHRAASSSSTLPGWIVVGQASTGCYEVRRAPRTDHTTADDVSGVFHLLHASEFSVYLVGHARRIGLMPARSDQARRLLGASRSCFVALGPRGGPLDLQAPPGVSSRTPSSSAPAQIGQLIARKYQLHPEYGINLVGFMDDDRRRSPRGSRRLPICSARRSICRRSCRRLHIERAFVIAFTKDLDRHARPDPLAAGVSRSRSMSYRGCFEVVGPERRHPQRRRAAPVRLPSPSDSSRRRSAASSASLDLGSSSDAMVAARPRLRGRRDPDQARLIAGRCSFGR